MRRTTHALILKTFLSGTHRVRTAVRTWCLIVWTTAMNNSELRECFDRIKPVMAGLKEKMIFGDAVPGMLRNAMKRLSDMLTVAGDTGDIKTENELVSLMAELLDTAIHTMYF
jgi:hypothetical protein